MYSYVSYPLPPPSLPPPPLTSCSSVWKWLRHRISSFLPIVVPRYASFLIHPLQHRIVLMTKKKKFLPVTVTPPPPSPFPSFLPLLLPFPVAAPAATTTAAGSPIRDRPRVPFVAVCVREGGKNVWFSCPRRICSGLREIWLSTSPPGTSSSPRLSRPPSDSTRDIRSGVGVAVGWGDQERGGGREHLHDQQHLETAPHCWSQRVVLVQK